MSKSTESLSSSFPAMSVDSQSTVCSPSSVTVIGPV